MNRASLMYSCFNCLVGESHHVNFDINGMIRVYNFVPTPREFVYPVGMKCSMS